MSMIEGAKGMGRGAEPNGAKGVKGMGTGYKGGKGDLALFVGDHGLPLKGRAQDAAGRGGEGGPACRPGL